MLVGVTTRTRRVFAVDPGAAAVAVADVLDRSGKLNLDSGANRIVLVRRYSAVKNFPWLEVTITAAAVTTYHATRVHPWAGGKSSP